MTIDDEIKKSKRLKDAERYVYYIQALNNVAIVSWDDDGSGKTWFKNSFAYLLWIKQNNELIQKS